MLCRPLHGVFKETTWLSHASDLLDGGCAGQSAQGLFEKTRPPDESEVNTTLLNVLSAPWKSFGLTLVFIRCSCCLPSAKACSSAWIFSLEVLSKSIMGFSWAPATLVKASEGLKLCGTHRTRPRHRAIESWMIATSSADRSQSPEDCSVAAASKRDLASMIATLSGSVNPGSSEAMTVGAPRRPRWSSDSACWRGSNRDSLKLFHIAIWRSSAPKAVDNDMLSQSMVLPAFLLSLLDFHASSEMGASDPWLRRESVIPWSHPCCGFDRPVGSKDESAITKCLTSSSAMLWIRKVTRCDLILRTALFASKTSWTVGCGKLPAKMGAAAAASGLPSRATQFKLAMVPRSCASSSALRMVCLASFISVFLVKVTGRNLFST